MTLTSTLRSFVQPVALFRPAHEGTNSISEDKHAGEPQDRRRVNLGGVPIRLMEVHEAINRVLERARAEGPTPLAVASANLDHIKHFGRGARWNGVLEQETAVEWISLLDGAPLVSQAERITRNAWPRLAGSDLIGPILEAAEVSGLRVGFLGGTEDVHALIKERFRIRYPDLQVGGYWAPVRATLTDPQASAELAAKIAASETDVLVVCLGKPRQELWISEFGHLTGAKVLLAFGAVVDFLAGRVRRAPISVRNLGLEWAWRLALEPTRLAARYLMDGPEAYIKLRHYSEVGQTSGTQLNATKPVKSPKQQGSRSAPSRMRGFSPLEEHTDVAVLVVTYNSEKDAPLLVESLRSETRDQSIKIIVADNSPSPATSMALRHVKDIHVFHTGGNLGYAGGINAARKRAGTADSYLILNPDMRVGQGSVRAMRERMTTSGAGAVVPLLLEDDGSAYISLRREPSVFRALGDALLGSKFPGRPAWLSEMEFDAESYLHPHKVDWATGAAILIRPDVAEQAGEWDERYFLYSEETDYLRRIRDLGATIWFEPKALLRHSRGGSGSSPALAALMAVNRIKYVQKYHPGHYARAFRAVVVLSALMRASLPSHRSVLGTVCRSSRWEELPHASRYSGDPERPGACKGSIIIPAHNEANVIARTASRLAPLAEIKQVEVIVACNGCTDDTERVLADFPYVKVVSIADHSKAAALRAGDAVAMHWPRLYVDADVEIEVSAITSLLFALGEDGGPLAVRPAARYVSDGASLLVRAYYRARNRIPAHADRLWGGGVYGLSKEGHARMGQFPMVTADDYFIDGLFDPSEKRVLPTDPVLVRTPLRVKSLLATLCRVYRGVKEQPGPASTTHKTLKQLVTSVRGPQSAFDAFVYGSFAAAGRLRRTKSLSWERDESSRIADGPSPRKWKSK